MEGQVPVYLSPKNRVAHLYPRALGSLFVATYNIQSCGGGILIRLHGARCLPGITNKPGPGQSER
jgi:hypothetical protein